MLSACEIMVVAAVPSYTWYARVSVHLVRYRRAPGNARSRSSDLGESNENLLAGAGSTPGVRSPAQLQVGDLVVSCFPRSVVFDGSACSVLFRTSFTKRSISLSRQRSREKKFPESLARLPVGWRRRAMQPQLRYCCA